MSKPAARLGDPVVHPLPPVLTGGPGSFDVLIGGKPAWRGIPAASAAALQVAKKASDLAIKTAEAATLAAAGTPAAPGFKAAEETTKATAASTMGSMISGMAMGADIHSCTTPLPVPPHGPGVVIDGSATVLINGLPACRMGDTIVEAVGPPNKIVMGCPTVLIGDSSGMGMGTPTPLGSIPLAPGAVTPEQAQEIFNQMADQEDIAFEFPVDGCYARAHLMAQRMQDRGVTPSKVWTLASPGDPLWVQTPNHPDGRVQWSYHVAPTIPVQGADGKVQDMVIDPSMFDRPVPIQEWVDDQHDSPRVIQTELGEPPIPENGGTGYWPTEDPEEGPDAHAEETMEEYKRLEGTRGY